MSIIKKWSFVVVMIVAIASMVFMAGCGGSKLESTSSTASGGSETAKETVAESKVNGKTYETEKFSILVPDGWETTDMEPGVLIKPSNEEDRFIIVQVNRNNVTEAEIKAEVEELIKTKPAFAPLTEVTMLGIKFFKISGIAENGSEQTAYAGVRNGEKVAIVIGGKDHQNDKTLKAMLESIKFK
jgi:hypothetical protein